ncbi:unnamed protein product [Rhizoctonia solani]|uniref:Uncharacterized protein n=1 Tax=Rhizoctonia solani TaxID=456999 RepID=A0A8H3AIX8_9AGAM
MSIALARTGSGRIMTRPRQASTSSVRSTSAHLSPPPSGISSSFETGELDPVLAALDISHLIVPITEVQANVSVERACEVS